MGRKEDRKVTLKETEGIKEDRIVTLKKRNQGNGKVT